jgi:hypothetical protein
VKKFLLFAIVVLVFVSACKRHRDLLVAEAFHKKLYFSDIIKKTPFFTSKEDSLIFLENYVQDWILRQTLLAQAKQGLTLKEQDFSFQIEQYQEQLLINTYFQKISNNTALSEVSKKELDDFLNETKTTEETPEYKDMVKLNYVKLSNPSKLYKKIKELFFSDEERVKSLAQIELLCADTIEYYLDSEHWFYADFIEKELPFTFSDTEEKDLPKRIDIVKNGSRYLILILDKKQQIQPKNVSEDRKMAQVLLQQQKRAAFIINFQDSLVKKAVQERKAIFYPIHL